MPFAHDVRATAVEATLELDFYGVGRVTRCFMLGGVRSGAGKTTLTLALLGAFQRRGLRVRAFKTGPDFIDPEFHASVTATPVFNLDSWAMPSALSDGLIAHAASESDLVIIESAMGLFDGLSGPPNARGAAADVAKRYHLPVVLVADVAGQGETANAVVHGLAHWDDGVHVAGVIYNRVASDRHERMCRRRSRLPIFGSLRYQTAYSLPSRHLGLHQAAEIAGFEALRERLAQDAVRALDLDAIWNISAELPKNPGPHLHAISPPGQRIALASDAAFSFFYPHILESWRQAGADIVPFSPLADEAPARDTDVCWLAGGYPELYLRQLSQNFCFRDGMRRYASRAHVHGECGGYMILGESIEDKDGTHFPMLNLLSHQTTMRSRRPTLGYREVRLKHTGALGAVGSVLRGHEFHYAQVSAQGQDVPLLEMRDGEKEPIEGRGGARGTVTGTFFHVIADRTSG